MDIDERQFEVVVRGRNVEVPDHFRQHVTDKLAYLPQRMVLRHARLRRDVREQSALIHKPAPHADLQDSC